MSWPHAEGISFPDSYERVMPTFVEMVEALASSEPVYINVRDSKEESEVRRRFSSGAPPNVRFFHIPTNEPWCRDHGPLFLVNREKKERLILDWGYNAWGGKYPPYDLDDDVPTEIGRSLGIESVKIPMVLEGGSLDFNGAGTVLTTESCLLNPNRNPSLNRAQIEQNLRENFGVQQILWLGDGIEGDDTDGHVDDLTRFISRTTVLTVMEENPRDPNHGPLMRNWERLQKMRLPTGEPLKIVTLPMPREILREEMRLPASYANFYIANRVVLLPVFNDPNDDVAIKVLEGVFPHRKVIPIDCRELIWGLGAFHCLTQQQPSV